MLVTHKTAEDRQTSVEVREATIADKLRRGSMMQANIKAFAKAQADVLEGVVRFHTFPTCIACSCNLQDTAQPDIALDTMTFEQFIDLPEQFVEKWLSEVFRLNPGWMDEDILPRARPSSRPDEIKSS